VNVLRPNLFSSPPERPEGEWTQLLAQGPGVRIERIVSRGDVSPPGFWYDQVEHEWVAVMSGSARIVLRNPDEIVALSAGDHVFIAAHRPHRVDWTAEDEETIWLAVFFTPEPPSAW
jgi:cupin 2 domain-containing protein